MTSETDEGAGGDQVRFIGKEIPWKQIEADLFRVVGFTPLATVVDGRIKEAVAGMPYGLLAVESPILNHEARMPVNHREEYLNLWDIYQEEGGVSTGTALLVSYLPYRGFFGIFVRMFQARVHFRLRATGELERYYSDESHWLRPSARDYFFPKSILGNYCSHCKSKLYTFVVRCSKCRRPVLD